MIIVFAVIFAAANAQTIAPNKAGGEKEKWECLGRNEAEEGVRLAMHHSGRSLDCSFVFTVLHMQQ